MGLALGTVLAGSLLVLMEGSLRLFDLAPVEPYGRDAHQQRGVFVYDADLFWAQRPGYTQEERAPDGGIWDIRIDAEGHRSDPFPTPAPPGTVGILGIGDSSMWGDRVPQAERFLDRATRAVRDAVPDASIALTTAACPGYSSFQARRQLPPLLATGRYQVVVMLVMNSDFYPNPRADTSFVPTPWLRPLAWVGRHSMLLRWLRPRGRPVLGGFGERPDTSQPLVHRVPARPDYQANLDAMVVASQEAGAEVILLEPFRFWTGGGGGPPPFYPEPILSWMMDSTPEYHAVMEEVGRARGATVLSLQPLVEREPTPGALYADTVHPSALGHERIAALLAPALQAAVRRRQAAGVQSSTPPSSSQTR
ncbi:MAG: SGNH/GDSL hydrolase family protein [Pseudomonadota bacterium]